LNATTIGSRYAGRAAGGTSAACVADAACAAADGVALTGRPNGRAASTAAQGSFGAYNQAMAQTLPVPPPGFDDLPVEDKIDYVQALWDRIAAQNEQVPLHEWQRLVIEERLAAHRSAPHEARPWKEVLDALESRLKAR
jgi:putative addiction module component (TIGR02574 family)